MPCTSGSVKRAKDSTATVCSTHQAGLLPSRRSMRSTKQYVWLASRLRGVALGTGARMLGLPPGSGPSPFGTLRMQAAGGGPDEADLVFACATNSVTAELGTTTCGLHGRGPPPPDSEDDDMSSTDLVPEDCEIEDTQELEIWDAIQERLDKLEPLVDVEGMTRVNYSE